MKLVSKRGRVQVRRSQPLPGMEVIEYELIVRPGNTGMSADEIKTAEETFKRMREQLEHFGRILP